MSIIKTIQFRFKSPVVTTTTPPSQSLFVNIDNDDDPQFTVVLEHTSSLVSGSYSGSIPDPYSKYGTLKFTHEDIGTSASVYLPFLDGGWWSVMVAQSSQYTYTLYAANKLYDGVDGNTVGFKATASLTGSLDWNNASTVYFPGSGSTTTLSKTYVPFDGELQELRYFTETITEQQFDAYTQNPNSIEGSSNLTFRASLGGELFKNSSSIHPGVGGAVQSNSFSTGNTFTLVSGSFGPNYETILIDQVEGGVRNRIAGKIKRPNLVLPSSSSIFSNIPDNKVLSSQLQIQQNLQVSQSSTRDVNYAEVTLSPQNEINDDINATYGYFNIGNYIGDPRQITSSLRDYPDLVNLKNSYFNKYSKSYNYKDYIRLSKYYDNAVFQMIKDFTPVRTGLATGVTVKQHLLERNRVRPAQVSLRDETLTGSIKPQSRGYEAGTMEVFSGGPGGSVNSLTGSNQAWTASYSTPVGLVTRIESSQYEFYNGEYSGSTITAQISHSINPDPTLNNVTDNRASTIYQDVDYSYNAKTPVNLDLILSGSAFPAIVPDSNYTSLRSITPRYLGSKNSGEINYNQSFADRSIQTGYPVDNQTPWFAHFNGIYNSIELGYQVGGNMNITTLVNAETLQVIELTSENKNLDFLGQLFRPGDTPSIVPIAKTTTEGIVQNAIELEAVGTLYQTIMVQNHPTASGSIGISYETSSIGWDGLAFINSGTDKLVAYTDTNPLYQAGWLAALVKGGNISRINVLDGTQIWNTTLNQYTSASSIDTIAYQDTLLPIQPGDFIRTADSAVTGTTTGLDYPENALTNLRPILSTYGDTVPGYLEMVGTLPTVRQNQFRIIRKVPTEFYMIVKKQPAGLTGEGLVLPHNFDKRYNAKQVAIDLNIIQTT